VSFQLNDTLGIADACERKDLVLDTDVRARAAQVIYRLLGAPDGIGQIGSVEM
jgi:hypothetical protein